MDGCIAYGDCNTEGLKGYREKLWPEMVAEQAGLALTNCGHTMCTTRELRHYAADFPPGNFRLQQRLGEREQVPLDKYLATIAAVVRSAPQTRFVLVATPFNLDEPRNPRIRRYNQALESLAGREPNAVFADASERLWESRKRTMMADGTHLAADGHRIMAEAVINALSH